MPTLTAAYMGDLARVRLEAADLLPEVVYGIDRSSDGGVTWTTVRGATNVTDGGVTVVYDYEYAPNIENRYQLTQPIVSDTFERTIAASDPLVGAGAIAPSSGSDPAVAPSVSMPAPGGLLISAWTSWDVDTPYTLPGSMTAVTQQVGFFGTSAVATQTVGPAATGTRSAIAGQTDSWSAVSVAVPGTVTIQDADWDYAEEGPVSVTTSAATVGWWLVAIHATDSGNTEPESPGLAWSLLVDTGETSINNSRTLVWVRQVDTAGAQSVNVPQVAGVTDNFLTVLLLSGVEAPAVSGWGSADTGQPWLLYGDSGIGRWSVSGGAGRVIGVDDQGFGIGRYLPIDVTDVEVRHDVILLPGDPGLQQTRLSIRGDGSSVFTGYQVILTPEGDNEVSLAIFTGDGPSQETMVGTWQTGQRWRVRVRVVGTVIEARAWNTANPEPSTWQMVATSMLAASGTVGLSFNLSGTDGGEGIADNFFVYQVPPLVVAEAAVTPDQDDVWLKSIAFPSLNQNLGCISTTARTRRSRVGLFDVKGRSAILGIADVGSTETFTAVFSTYSQEQNVGVAALLTFGAPLLLQSPPDEDPTGCGNIAAYPSGWFMPGDNVEARPLRGRRVWEWQVPLTRVAAPSSQSITPAHMTWSVLWQMVSTWVELWDEWGTWAELWDASVTPAAMYQALSGGEG